MQLLISILVIIITALAIAIIGIVFFYKQNKELLDLEDEILQAFEDDLKAQLDNADTLGEILRRLK